MTLEAPPDDHYELLKRCDFHLAYMGCSLFVDLVQHKHPFVIVDSTEDVKTIELGCLTYDENEMVDSIVFRGLGFTKGLSDNTGILFVKDVPGPTIKKEPEQDTESVSQDNIQEENIETPVESSPPRESEPSIHRDEELEKNPPESPIQQGYQSSAGDAGTKEQTKNINQSKTVRSTRTDEKTIMQAVIHVNKLKVQNK